MVTSIERSFPIDGPHTPERAARAAEGIEHLARYLAHATRPGQARTSLASAPDVDVVVASLRIGLRSTAQVLDQVADRLARLAEDPTLRIDQLGDPAEPAALAVAASTAATRAAGALRDVDARHLDVTSSSTSRLYHADREG